MRRDALLFAAFDQRIDPAAVLASVRVRAAGATSAVASARLATAAEVDQDEVVARLAESAEPGRWLAFRTEAPLPPDAAVEVSVGPGTPSAEGARKSESAERWSFRTYGPFRVRRSECGSNGRCAPFDAVADRAHEPDRREDAGERGRARRARAGRARRLESWGDTLAIRGVAEGRTRYRVSLVERAPRRLRPDARARRAAHVRRGSGAARAALPGRRLRRARSDGRGGLLGLLDQPPVAPRRGERRRRRRTGRRGSARADRRLATSRRRCPAARVLETTLRVAGEPDALAETRIDLAPALADGLGQLVVSVRPTAAAAKDARDAVFVWVQATRIGLDAFVDGDTLVAWATTSPTGRRARGRRGARRSAGAHAAHGGRRPRPAPARRRPRRAASSRGAERTSRSSRSRPAGGAGRRLRRRARQDALRFYVFDDRKLYRPGEEVRVKGWLRRIGAGPGGDVEPPPDVGALARVDAARLAGQRVREGHGTALGAVGGFDLALTLPPTMNLGTASLQLEADAPGLDSRTHLHSFSGPGVPAARVRGEGGRERRAATSRAARRR